MAVALRKHDEDFDDPPMSDINVTPLVDVMLVLLIVFMVAAPLMTSGIPVDLPKTQAKPLNDQKPPIAVSLDAGGKYFVGSTEVQPDQLLAVLLNQAENGLDQRIHVRADKDLPYRAILEVMGKITSAGFTKVALVSNPPPGAQLPLPAPAAAQPPGPVTTAPSAPTAPVETAQPASPTPAPPTPAIAAPAVAPAQAPQSVAPAVAPPASSGAPE
ncbi:ExbD/TolR family protein [Hyphomicrobium sp. 2TAF46]|uniref:ExbD/TolR family protein n=1 Tax=Hyphomicrobium sp. 2TAF46 TaxID=3233019 RepID=UPI003F8E7A74